MKVQIVKYLNSKGKVVEMRKDNFKGRDLPENIIEEYEVEIKGEDSNEPFWFETNWLEDLKRKYEKGNYILLWKANSNLKNPIAEDSIWTICNTEVEEEYWDYKLIHNKHKGILEAYLKNPSVEIETGMFTPMTGETEPSKWVDLEKDFIEDYNEEFWYRLKVKDLAWYKEGNIRGILLKAENSQTGLNELCIFKHKNKDAITAIRLDGKEFTGFFSNFRPATESEALSLVYKSQQKVSKEKVLAESNRLKDLFLNDKAECLVENEQEFRLVYAFLNKTHDKSLDRYLELDGSFDFTLYNNKFPIIIITNTEWGYLYGWDRLKDRDLTKPLIKFNGETFWEVTK